MKRNTLDKIKEFFKEVMVEMKRVNWLSKEQTKNYTIIVIALSLGLAICLGLFDYFFVSIIMKLKF